MDRDLDSQISAANATLVKVLEELTARATDALGKDDHLRARVYLRQLSIVAAEGEESQAKMAAYRYDR